VLARMLASTVATADPCRRILKESRSSLLEGEEGSKMSGPPLDFLKGRVLNPISSHRSYLANDITSTGGDR